MKEESGRKEGWEIGTSRELAEPYRWRTYLALSYVGTIDIYMSTFAVRYEPRRNLQSDL